MDMTDALKILKDYAAEHLNAVIKSGTAEEVAYWRGYGDAITASIRIILQTSTTRKDEKQDEDN